MDVPPGGQVTLLAFASRGGFGPGGYDFLCTLALNLWLPVSVLWEVFVETNSKKVKDTCIQCHSRPQLSMEGASSTVGHPNYRPPDAEQTLALLSTAPSTGFCEQILCVMGCGDILKVAEALHL